MSRYASFLLYLNGTVCFKDIIYRNILPLKNVNSLFNERASKKIFVFTLLGVSKKAHDSYVMVCVQLKLSIMFYKPYRTSR